MLQVGPRLEAHMLRARRWARSEQLPLAGGGAASVAPPSSLAALALACRRLRHERAGRRRPTARRPPTSRSSTPLLAQELTTIDAYERGLPLLRGQIARRRRGSSAGRTQAHVDALTKAMRGLGGETDAEAERARIAGAEEPGRGARSRLRSGERGARRGSGRGAPQLQIAAPRTLAASLAASHAQHLVVLRQAGSAPASADLRSRAPSRTAK